MAHDETPTGQPSQVFPTDSLIRWPNPQKGAEKDKRGDWLYGLVIDEHAHGVRAQVLDFEWRQAFDLATTLVPWSVGIHDADGTSGLHELVRLTAEGRTDSGFPAPAENDEEVTGDPWLERPVDQLPAEMLRFLTERYGLPFAEMMGMRIYNHQDGAKRKNRDLLKARLVRFYEHVLPVALEEGWHWNELIRIIAAPRTRDGTPFQQLAGRRRLQAQAVRKVYWNILVTRQSHRIDYREMSKRGFVEDARGEGDRLRQRGIAPSSQEAYDHLLDNVRQIYRSDGSGKWLDVIYPDTWEAKVWALLAPLFHEATTDRIWNWMLRDHWEQPYFHQILQGFVTGIGSGPGAVEKRRQLGTEINIIAHHRGKPERADWEAQTKALLPEWQPRH